MALQPTGHQPHGPLSTDELSQLEATLLPALERHHLRLLAHALRTLQQIAANQGLADSPVQPLPLPDAEAIRAWVGQQPAVAAEADFIDTLSQQLLASGAQLQQRAAKIGRSSALELRLDDLINWATEAADQRLVNAPPTTLPATPEPPPADR